jgi:hypothetical protein
MPIFEIQNPDGKIYEVDAPNQQAALDAMQGYQPPQGPNSGGGQDGQLSLAQKQALAMGNARKRMAETKFYPESQLITALKNADAAGDTAAAQKLADTIRAQRAAQADNEAVEQVKANTLDLTTPEGRARQRLEGERPDLFGNGQRTYLQGVDDRARAIANGVPLIGGWMDEIGAGLNTGFGLIGNYDDALAYERLRDGQQMENRPGETLTGNIGGGLVAGGAAGKLFAGAMPTAASSMLPTSTVGRIGTGIGGAAGLGFAEGYSRGEGVDGRLAQGGVSALVGGGLAAAAPVVGALARPVMARINPGGETRKQIAGMMERAGLTPGTITDDLAAAQAQGQGSYMVGDALGLQGQRAISTLARTPGEGRDALVKGLTNRQAGQGRRVSGFVAEGFDAPDTAMQRTASLTSARKATANANYGAADAAAGAVDVSPAIQAADEFLKPGANSVVSIGAGVPNDGIRGAVAKAKRYLTDGKSQVSDYSAALDAKREIDAMIESATPTVQGRLKPVRDALDDALAKASQPYAAARDAYRTQSKGIEAVDAGRKAATRGRSENTIAQFNAMTPDEQAAFRAGYADPLIEGVQGGAVGANKVRGLLNDATAAEFPAFAAPGQASTLTSRLNREQAMFDALHAAVGGSKTADNLADMAGGMDPSIIGNLLTGNIGTAGMNAARTYGAALFKGQPKSVRERLVEALMETNPANAQAMLTKAMDSAGPRVRNKGDLIRALLLGDLAGSGTGMASNAMDDERTRRMQGYGY